MGNTVSMTVVVAQVVVTGRIPFHSVLRITITLAVLHMTKWRLNNDKCMHPKFP